MVEPSKTLVVTLTVPGEVLARAQAAQEAETDALIACGDECTAAEFRALALARHELADACWELASYVNGGKGVLPRALRRYALGRRDDADNDDALAAHLDTRTEGDAS